MLAAMKVALAASAGRKPAHHASATQSRGRCAARAAAFTAGELRHFDRASNPNTNGF
jgi:hypothetical protein